METKRAAVYPLAMTAVLAALMAVAAPFSVAIGPVPLSFCTLVIYLAGYLLGGRRAALATLAYILLGAVGMPVFSGFSAGLGVLAGTHGGIRSRLSAPGRPVRSGGVPLPPEPGPPAAGDGGGDCCPLRPGHRLVLLPVGGGPGPRPGRLRAPLPARRPAENAGRHGGGPRPPGTAGPGGH